MSLSIHIFEYTCFWVNMSLSSSHCFFWDWEWNSASMSCVSYVFYVLSHSLLRPILEWQALIIVHQMMLLLKNHRACLLPPRSKKTFIMSRQCFLHGNSYTQQLHSSQNICTYHWQKSTAVSFMTPRASICITLMDWPRTIFTLMGSYRKVIKLSMPTDVLEISRIRTSLVESS